jgi:conjugal transfer mating pair stabilization protein TraG
VWEIYSIGDAAYLAAILNAVAAIAGTEDLKQLAAVGFLLGVLLVMFQAILSGGRVLALQNLLVAWILYAGLFGPKASVAIEDAYSGAVVVVDNVPLGPAAVGSLLSTVGYQVTRLFETAFSTPAMTEYGFADTLGTLLAVRRAALSRLALGPANSPAPGADLERSFVNYVAECTLAGVDIEVRSVDDILEDPDPLAALAFDSDVYTTEVFLGGAGRTETCTAASQLLAEYVAGEFLPRFTGTLTAALGVDRADEVEAKVQHALDTLAGAGIAARDYMVMAALLPFFEQGVVRTHQDLGQWTLAASVEQAMAQRNAQWATEETLFARVVRPMMTFFEGFLYAVSPLMAFAIALGPVGIAMVGKYLLMALWIQLWMPVLAIVNLYLQMAAAGQLEAIQSASGAALPSMYAMFQLDLLLQDYLGVGGMLASSVPALSLMLVYGSAVTATHLASRLQGGDFVDEKLTSPDVVRPAPALALSPSVGHAPLTGTVTTGAERVLPTFTVGRDLTDSVTSSSSALAQTSEAFTSQLATTAARAASRSGESFESRSLAWDYSASGSQTDRAVVSVAEDLAQRYRDSHLSSDQLASVVGGSLGAGFHGRSLGAAQAEIEGILQSRYGVGSGLAHDIASDITKRVTEDHDFVSRLARAVESDSSAGRRSVFTEGLRSEELSSLSHQASKTRSASEAYTQAVSLQQRFGTSASFGAVETGRAIAQDPLLGSRLEEAIAAMGLTGDLQRLAHEWRYARNFADPEQARAAAGMALLLGYEQPSFRTLDQGERTRAQSAGLALLGATFGGPRVGEADPTRSDWVRSAAPTGGALGPGSESIRADAAGLPGAVAEAHRSVDNLLATADDQVRWRRTVDEDHWRERAVTGTDEVRAATRERIAARIVEEAGRPRSPAQLELETLGGLVRQVAEEPPRLLESARGALTEFLDAYARTGSLIEAARAAPDGWEAAAHAFVERQAERAAGFGLTAPQVAVYREALRSALPDLDGLHRTLDSDLARARESLREAEGGSLGDAQGELLVRAATAREDGYLRLLGTYNRTGERTLEGTATGRGTDHPPTGH